MAALSRLRHLRSLDLSLCCALDDAALLHLSGCKGLAELHVRACWRLSHAGGLAVAMRGRQRGQSETLRGR